MFFNRRFVTASAVVALIVISGTSAKAQNLTVDFVQPGAQSLSLLSGFYAVTFNGRGFVSSGVQVDGINYRDQITHAILGEYNEITFDGMSMRMLAFGAINGPNLPDGDTYTTTVNVPADRTFAVVRNDSNYNNGDSGAVNYSFTRTGSAVVAPEPGTIALVGMAGIGLVFIRRRRA